MTRFEQVDVKRIFEVGGRVRCDHERGSVGLQHAREFGDVLHRVREVLDDVRRDDRVERAVAHRQARPVHACEAQRGEPEALPAATTVGAL